MKIIVIAPHPDDETLGCGGVIRLHVHRGESVNLLVLTSGEKGLSHLREEDAWGIRESEALAASQTLGISHIEFARLPDLGLIDNIEAGSRVILKMLRRVSPAVIYLPHPQDGHIDHMSVLTMTRAALRHYARGNVQMPLLLGYEVWTPMEKFDRSIDITTTMDAKLAAIRLYSSQLQRYAHDEAALGLARYRGVMTNQGTYVEVFSELPTTTARKIVIRIKRILQRPVFLRLRRRWFGRSAKSVVPVQMRPEVGWLRKWLDTGT